MEASVVNLQINAALKTLNNAYFLKATNILCHPMVYISIRQYICDIPSNYL